jgi:hypothetical protein
MLQLSENSWFLRVPGTINLLCFSRLSNNCSIQAQKCLAATVNPVSPGTASILAPTPYLRMKRCQPQASNRMSHIMMDACLNGLLPELDLSICNFHSHSIEVERQNEIY